ncbi:MAG: hypothetical protein H5T69_04900 [Chloroflexi bacterium]|nr:hypothetical protein [Chloroflexota bacterium]
MRRLLIWLLCLSVCMMVWAGPTALADPPSRTPARAQTPAGSPPRPIPVKIEGLVDVVEDSVPGQISVEGLWIQVTAATVITPAGYTPQVGDQVTVHALVDGELFMARSVHIHLDMANAGPTEFQGRISQLSQRRDEVEVWVIAGQRVEVDQRAIVIGAPAVGYYAHVQGFVGLGGDVRATWIRVFNPSDVISQFEFEGIITEWPQTPSWLGLWVIGNRVGLVHEGTQITGTPALGAAAEVRGRQLSDGSLVWDEIRILDEDVYVRVQGLIEQLEIQRGIAPSSLSGYLVIGGRRILLGGQTLLDESEGRAAPGMWADVVAIPVGENILDAVRVRIARPD